jgi:hypothetical protein
MYCCEFIKSGCIDPLIHLDLDSLNPELVQLIHVESDPETLAKSVN